jgi:transcription initiation factor TFIIB
MSSEHLSCPQCGSSEIVFIEATGEYVCKRCGYVVYQTNLDRSQEWRAFNEEEAEELNRSGPPRSLDNDFSTKIGVTKSKEGDKMDPSKYLRLSKWQNRISNPYSASVLKKAINFISNVNSRLNCPKPIVEKTIELYKYAHKNKLIKGRQFEIEVLASFYLACKMMNQPRSLDEISSASGIRKSELARAYRELSWKLDVKPKVADEMELFLLRLMNKLKLSGETEKLAVSYLKLAKENKLTSGRSPISLAAACIYLASLNSGLSITQKEVARVSGITEVTLRNRCKELVEVARRRGLNLHF